CLTCLTCLTGLTVRARLTFLACLLLRVVLFGLRSLLGGTRPFPAGCGAAVLVAGSPLGLAAGLLSTRVSPRSLFGGGWLAGLPWRAARVVRTAPLFSVHLSTFGERAISSPVARIEPRHESVQRKAAGGPREQHDGQHHHRRSGGPPHQP